MSDNQNFGFGKFVPGFDFLQNIAKSASQTLPHMPNLANWVAPTLNLEELEKRIGELKAVHFWLDQNSKALGATIQALEVQKMTLATLKGMNFSMGDVADALKLKAGETADAISGEATKSKATRKKSPPAGPPAGGMVDPLQWWGALTQQFQEIATTAMKDATAQSAVDTAKNMASGMAEGALKTATGMARAATGGARKSPGKRASRKK